jgi:hypothetical protein
MGRKIENCGQHADDPCKISILTAFKLTHEAWENVGT